MPKKILPTEEQFLFIKEFLEAGGFEEISEEEFRRNFRRLGLKAPRPRRGRETGFKFSENGLTVVVWTTWLKKEKRARESDAAWVIIVEDEQIVYSSHPIHRTKYFILNLLLQAIIAQTRVIHRPRCPECGEWMKIVHGKGIKSCYWQCAYTERHLNGQKIRKDWDFALTETMKKYLNRIRRKRAYYRRKRRKQGKPVPQAIFTRRSWQRNSARARSS